MANKTKTAPALPPGDPRKPGDPANCPVAPCPSDCPGMKLCKAVSGYDEPVDMAKITKEIADRDKTLTDTTKSNST